MNTRMFGMLVFAATLSNTAAPAIAQQSSEPAPKGTVCFANSIRDTERVNISCKGLGKFSSVAEIYERGYRIVSTSVIHETQVGTVVIFIEEKK
jgi:hypothetical protein